MAARRKTRGRRTPFKCGHKGFGQECNRCAQANELETRANELAQVIKTQGKTLPAYATASESVIRVRGGAHLIEAPLDGKQTRDGALTQIVEVMRQKAGHLQKEGRA